MSLQSMSVAAPKLQTAVLKYECFPDFTRGNEVLLAGNGAKRVVEVGTVLGKIALGAATVTKTDVGGGRGAITVANPGSSAGAPAGDYKIVFIEPATNAGSFEVLKPNGQLDGAGTVGVAYAGTVKFTIADGGTDFAAGDIGIVNVAYAAGSGKLVPFDQDAHDGSEVPYAIAIDKIVAPDGVDANCAPLVRGPAITFADGLIWPDDIDDGEKVAAIAVLEAKDILVRAD